METNQDYLRHFSARVFQQIINTVMTVTDGEAAGTAQLLRSTSSRTFSLRLHSGRMEKETRRRVHPAGFGSPMSVFPKVRLRSPEVSPDCFTSSRSTDSEQRVVTGGGTLSSPQDLEPHRGLQP